MNARIQHVELHAEDDGLNPGDVMLEVDNVSLSFGGVKAISDVSFNIHKGEIRAIIGPNGAGKTSMLNVINGFYHPQVGVITFKGEGPLCGCSPMRRPASGHCAHLPERGAVQGHVDARQHHVGTHAEDEQELLLAGAQFGPARDEEIEHRLKVEEIIDFLEIQHIRKTRWASCPTACKSASNLAGRWRWSRSCCCSTSRWRA
jgi:branched-chain amino acid transport system ATP-binding protein